MPNSITTDWLNENEQRAYPLQDGKSLIIDGESYEGVVLDANLVFPDTVPDEVTIPTIIVDTLSADIYVEDQLFEVDKAGEFPQYIRNEQGSLLVVGEQIKDILSGTYELTDVVFEPAVCNEFAGDWLGVQSLTFDDVGTKTGAITWNANLQMLVTIAGNTITLKAGAPYGTPIDCTKYFPSIPNDCADVISFINNVGALGNPDIFRLIAGNNVVVYDEPENNRIYIGLNFDTNDICHVPIPTPIPNI